MKNILNIFIITIFFSNCEFTNRHELNPIEVVFATEHIDVPNAIDCESLIFLKENIDTFVITNLDTLKLIYDRVSKLEPETEPGWSIDTRVECYILKGGQINTLCLSYFDYRVAYNGIVMKPEDTLSSIIKRQIGFYDLNEINVKSSPE